MARKMFREAIDKFRECPPSAGVNNKIGIAFHQLLQLDLAKKNYEAAVKLDPKFPQAINNLGTVYYSRKNYRKAMKCYRKALKLNPESASIWVNLGLGVLRQTQYQTSGAVLRQGHGHRSAGLRASEFLWHAARRA